MNTQLITVISALIGVIIGGIINYFAIKSVKEQEWKLAMVKERINKQEKVFSDFLLCGQKLLMQSTETKVSSAAELNVINDCFCMVELTATQEVTDAAREICDYVFKSHTAKPTEETRDFYKLKQTFIRLARAELLQIEGRRW